MGSIGALSATVHRKQDFPYILVGKNGPIELKGEIGFKNIEFYSTAANFPLLKKPPAEAKVGSAKGVKRPAGFGPHWPVLGAGGKLALRI